ncbi:hypothetical protein ACFSTD_02200 [Novosphingobium colocasiae]
MESLLHFFYRLSRPTFTDEPVWKKIAGQFGPIDSGASPVTVVRDDVDRATTGLDRHACGPEKLSLFPIRDQYLADRDAAGIEYKNPAFRIEGRVEVATLIGPQ